MQDRSDASESAEKIEEAKKAIGSFASGKSDVSSRHDDYLGEAFTPGAFNVPDADDDYRHSS